MKRRFVTVGARQVHYRRGGSGPPLVLLHQSPLSSRELAPLAERLADRFTVIVLDTPGYGSSEPLPVEAPTIGDYVDALSETLDALGLSRCALYGHLTGALLALELTRREPGRVVSAVLDGLPIFTEEERADLRANFAPPLEPHWDGSHLVWLWSRYRDHHIFFPWYRREAAARLDVDLPDPVQLHEGVVDFLRAGDGYRLAPNAVFRHSPLPALEELAVPTAIVAREGGALAGHLERLPSLPGTCHVECLPREDEQAVAWIRARLEQGDAAAEAPPEPEVAPVASRIVKSYVDTSYGQLLLRRGGSPAGRPLVMLHASPGSAAALEPLMRALAPSRSVLAFDTLGNGDSDKPGFEPDIADYAQVVREALDHLGCPEIDLYGTHTGSMIALELALLEPQRVRNVVLDGLPLIASEERAEYLETYSPSLEPRSDGAHLITAWNFIRDHVLWFPYYKRTREHIRWAQSDPSGPLGFSLDPVGLQRSVLELLKVWDSYPIAYRAVFRHDTRARLPGLRVRALICAEAADMMHVYLEEAGQLAPEATVLTLPSGTGPMAEALNGFLSGP